MARRLRSLRFFGRIPDEIPDDAPTPVLEPSQPQKDQAGSILFNFFPGEIRNLIYYYAFAEYADDEDVYNEDTCYKRPGYVARGKTNAGLLRTCQRVYEEAWFLPWTRRQHTIFFTIRDRRPEVTTTVHEMSTLLATIYRMRGEEATRMEHVRIFAQLFLLEPGDNLGELFRMPHFNPQTFTITIRHTDWWFWEEDEPLRIGSQFVRDCRLPATVTELRFELESIQRRRPQIEVIAKQMRDRWAFRRSDGCYLIATDTAKDETAHWEGSSTWNDQRWIRDETKPGKLEYHVQTVRFICQPAGVTPFEEDDVRNHPPELMADNFPQLHSNEPFVSVQAIHDRGIDPNLSASDLLPLLHSYQIHCFCKREGSVCCGEGLGAGWVEEGSDSRWCRRCRLEIEDPTTRNNHFTSLEL